MLQEVEDSVHAVHANRVSNLEADGARRAGTDLQVSDAGPSLTPVTVSELEPSARSHR